MVPPYNQLLQNYYIEMTTLSTIRPEASSITVRKANISLYTELSFITYMKISLLLYIYKS